MSYLVRDNKCIVCPEFFCGSPNGWNSENACQNRKQGRPRSEFFYRSSMIWVCTVCLGLFGRQLVLEI